MPILESFQMITNLSHYLSIFDWKQEFLFRWHAMNFSITHFFIELNSPVTLKSDRLFVLFLSSLHKWIFTFLLLIELWKTNGSQCHKREQCEVEIDTMNVGSNEDSYTYRRSNSFKKTYLWPPIININK